MTENKDIACNHCKTPHVADARFCPACGAPSDAVSAPAGGAASFVQELLTLAKGLTATLDVDALLKRVSQSAEHLFVCEAASILLLDEEKTHLFFKVATGEKGGVVTRFRVKVGEGVAGWVAEKRESLLINDVAADPRFTAKMDNTSGFKTKSLIAVPMMAGGELIGVLEVLNKKDDKVFTDADKNLLESLASLAGLAIANARLLGGFRNFYSNTIELLIGAIEARDPRLAGHCWRVAQRASSVGRKMGLDGQALKDLYYSALLHDIGLLRTSDGWNITRVLVTDSPHTEQTHPLTGATMIRGIDILKGAASLIPFHHENFDGSGFPRGLKGEAIPLGGHILSVIENTEEMRMNGYSEEQVMAALEEQAGKRFHPDVAAAYREVLQQELAKAM